MAGTSAVLDYAQHLYRLRTTRYGLRSL